MNNSTMRRLEKKLDCLNDDDNGIKLIVIPKNARPDEIAAFHRMAARNVVIVDSDDMKL